MGNQKPKQRNKAQVQIIVISSNHIEAPKKNRKRGKERKYMTNTTTLTSEIFWPPVGSHICG
jgi:hypothetical protein